MTTRDYSFERQYLEQVVRAAGLDGPGTERFVDATFERLRLGDELYGSNALSSNSNRNYRELAEEAVDIAAWGVLEAQRLYAAPVDDDVALEIRLRLIAAAAEALRAWVNIRDARDLYDDALAS